MGTNSFRGFAGEIINDRQQRIKSEADQHSTGRGLQGYRQSSLCLATWLPVLWLLPSVWPAWLLSLSNCSCHVGGNLFSLKRSSMDDRANVQKDPRQNEH
jgi:hypothetical protein